MKNMQKGFTLIELMIVVAIIAILAAIAVPAYQNYIIRSKVSEALSSADMARTAVSETYQSTGVTPTTNGAAGLPATVASITTTYMSDMEIGAGGAIKVTVQGTNSDADAKSIELTPYTNTGAVLASPYSGPITWKCTSTDMPVKYLPASCR